MIRTHSCFHCFSPLRHHPEASASAIGSKQYPNLRGTVDFCQTDSGVVVATEITGLPTSEDRCKSPVFGFHIHSGSRCSGNKTVIIHSKQDDFTSRPAGNSGEK